MHVDFREEKVVERKNRCRGVGPGERYQKLTCVFMDLRGGDEPVLGMHLSKVNIRIKTFIFVTVTF